MPGRKTKASAAIREAALLKNRKVPGATTVASREAAPFKNSEIPGATTVASATQPEKMQKSPSIFFSTTDDTDTDFLCPAYEGQGNIKVSCANEFLYTKGIPKPYHPVGGTHVTNHFSIEKLLYTFEAHICGGGIDDAKFAAAPTPEKLLKAVWERRVYVETYDREGRSPEAAACVWPSRGQTLNKKTGKWNQGQGYEQRFVFEGPFSPEDENQIELMLDMAVYCKFKSAAHMLEDVNRLIDTKGRDLVFAAPYDSVLGVGFGPEDARIQEAKGKKTVAWGKNLLGKALMKFRDGLTDEEIKKYRERLAEPKSVGPPVNPQLLEGFW